MVYAGDPYGAAPYGGTSETTSTPTPSGKTTQVFTVSDVFEPPAGVTSVDVLIVAGGGGGGCHYGGGGGGGAGGVRYVQNVAVSGPVTVTVGAGGAGSPDNLAQGVSGGDSTFGALTAVGGGGGGGWAGPGKPGGSGGGGSGWGDGQGQSGVGQPGIGTAGQGYDGRAGYNHSLGSSMAGGSGGGAGGMADTPSSDAAVAGGPGLYFGAEFGTNIGVNGWVGGGGAGAHSTGSSTSNVGGIGGGGAGWRNAGAATSGVANTGGGGGGGEYDNNSLGAPGGSGVVVIQYTTPTAVSGRPWALSTMNRAGYVLSTTESTIPASPNQLAEKWLPKPNEVEFTAFVEGAATVTTNGKTVELDPLALEADVVGKSAVTGDLMVAAIQTVTAEQIKTAILLYAAEDRITTEHIKVASSQDSDKIETQAHAKSAIMLDADQDRLSGEHAKTAVRGPYPSDTSQAHAKVAVVGGEVGKGSNSQSHMKVASVSDFTEPEISQGHIKIAAPTLAAEIRDSASHVKVAQQPQVDDVRNDAEHIKTLIRTKANAQVGFEQVKVAVNLEGYPVSVSAESLIVAQSGVGSLRNVQDHLKTLVSTEPVEIVGSGHTKVATETAPTQEVDAAHVKVFAFIPSHEVVSAAHIKAAVPFTGRRKVGWGLIL